MEVINNSGVQQQLLQQQQTNKLACTRCRSKRQKCDRKVGGCTRCKSTIFKCCYPERKKRRRKAEFANNLAEFNNFTNNSSAIKAPLTLQSNIKSSPQYHYNPLPSPAYSTNSTDYSQSSVSYPSQNILLSQDVFQTHLTQTYLTQIYSQYPILTAEDFNQHKNNQQLNDTLKLVAYYHYYGSQANTISGEMDQLYKKLSTSLALSNPSLINFKLIINLALIPLSLGNKARFESDLQQINHLSNLLNIQFICPKLSLQQNFCRSLVWKTVEKLNSIAAN